MARTLLVIALDGADFRLLGPWMASGELPNLAMLARDGARGPLRSVIPPLTPSAWTSFATGKNPGHHGVFGFAEPTTNSDELRPVTAASIRSATLWDYVREFGVPSAVVGVPMTYPPTPVPGGLVGCFMTPPGRRDFAQPPELLDEIESRFGPYPLYLDAAVFSVNLSAANIERFLGVLEHEADYKFRLTAWLAERFDARLVMLHVWGTDRIQHELWNLLDETHPQHNARLAARVREPMLDYFRGLDRRIGELRRALGDDVTTVVVSDHGFGPVYHVIDLNWWLATEGFIRFRRRLPTLLKQMLWRCGLTAATLTTVRVAIEHFLRRGGKKTSPLNLVGSAQRRSRRLVLSFRDVDWARSTAYSPPGLSIGALRLNVRGREPSGCVEPGAEYEAVRERLLGRLDALMRRLGIEDPDQHTFTGEALYGAACNGHAPDVLFLPLEAGYLPTNLFDFLTRKAVTKSRVWPGNHRMDGVLIAHGPHVRQGARIEGAQIIDLAPTLLHWLGCPVPSDLDGRVLHEAHAENAGDAAQDPVGSCAPARPFFDAGADLTGDEQDAIIERLCGLGYI